MSDQADAAALLAAAEAVDPPTILALLDRVEKAETAVERASRLADHWYAAARRDPLDVPVRRVDDLATDLLNALDGDQ